MAYKLVSQDYTPAGGEKIRITIDFKFILYPPSESDIIAELTQAGYSLISVSKGILSANKVVIELLSPGDKTMYQIGVSLCDTLNNSWNVYSATAIQYEGYSVSLIPSLEPSFNQVVVIVAIAVIAIAVIYVISSARKVIS